MPVMLIDGTSVTQNPKGVGRYAFNLCDQLSRQLPDSWTIEVLAYQESMDILEGLKRLNVHYVPKTSDLYKGIVLIPRFARKVKADLILFANDCATVRHRVPVVTICHDIPAYIRRAQICGGVKKPRAYRRLIDRLKEKLIARSLRNNSIVFCNSRFMQTAVCDVYGVKLENTRVSYCAVDEKFYRFDLSRDEGRTTSRRFPTRFVLTFATGDFRENFLKIPVIAMRLKENGVRTCFVVAGVDKAADYFFDLDRRFKVCGLKEGQDYIYEGFLGDDQFDELVGLYADADFYLDLSLNEGFGMQVIEAMACGTTCIVSNRGALPEITGGYVLLVEPTDTSLDSHVSCLS